MALLLAPATISAAALGPSPYLSFADSPFNGGSFSYFHLETFEDGALNTPGVAASGGVLAILPPAPLTDSVDGDDGGIDGLGNGGHSLFSNNDATSISFTFDANVLGALPTHIGIVWTDVGSSSLRIGVDNVSLEAFDPFGNSLGTLGPFTLGDGLISGETAEDRFLGWADPGGISKFTISSANSNDWELDHLQYARSAVQEVPESGPGLLGLTALLTVVTVTNPLRWRIQADRRRRRSLF